MASRIWLALLLCAGICSTSCAQQSHEYGFVEAQSDDDIAERRAIFDEVAVAVRARDFARLNAMSQDMRDRRTRTPSGVWRLAYFYYGVEAAVIGRQSGCAPMDPQLYVDWAAVDPQQPAAYIALASAHRRRAWCLRGGDYAREVSPLAMEHFNQIIADTRRELESHEAIASRDPQYYQVLIDLALSQGLPRAVFQDLLATATDQHPYYYGIYFAASPYYMPQWHGVPGDIDALAQWAADTTEQHDASGAYARVIWYVDSIGHLDNREVNWARMEQSMDELAEMYPTDWNFANFARLSCRLNHPEVAARYFGMIRNDEPGTNWSDRAEWQRCRAAAGV